VTERVPQYCYALLSSQVECATVISCHLEAGSSHYQQFSKQNFLLTKQQRAQKKTKQTRVSSSPACALLVEKKVYVCQLVCQLSSQKGLLILRLHTTSTSTISAASASYNVASAS
jgi:hypothetical protein